MKIITFKKTNHIPRFQTKIALKSCNFLLGMIAAILGGYLALINILQFHLYSNSSLYFSYQFL